MNKPIDLLSLLHFINFFIFGLFYKKKYKLAFILGIIWEIFEYGIVNYPQTRHYIKKYWPIPQKYWDETHMLNPVLDIFFNMLGYYLANLLSC